jgi:hypothetical protein
MAIVLARYPPWQVAIRVMTTRKQSFRRFGLIR